MAPRVLAFPSVGVGGTGACHGQGSGSSTSCPDQLRADDGPGTPAGQGVQSDER